MREAGCDIPEFMLEVKKPNKRLKRKLQKETPKRSTILRSVAKHYKRKDEAGGEVKEKNGEEKEKNEEAKGNESNKDKKKRFKKKLFEKTDLKDKKNVLKKKIKTKKSSDE
jgi:ATP-dependent RNA helicase DDX52/ROK1